METFKMIIVKDKAKCWRDDIGEICRNLRERGYDPQGFERDRNYFYIGGVKWN